MRCPVCEAQLPDNARFCPQCGSSVESPDQLGREPTGQWEIAETNWYKSGIFKSSFGVNVTTPTGSYFIEDPLRASVVRDDYGPMSSDPKTHEAHQRIVRMLLDDGWEPLSKSGQWWWIQTFRRPAVRSRKRKRF